MFSIIDEIAQPVQQIGCVFHESHPVRPGQVGRVWRGGALALYWIVARALRISEVAELAAALAAQLGW
jgi:hypothetical protein